MESDIFYCKLNCNIGQKRPGLPAARIDANQIRFFDWPRIVDIPSKADDWMKTNCFRLMNSALICEKWSQGIALIPMEMEPTKFWNRNKIFGVGTKIFGIDSEAMWFIGDEQKLVISNYMLMKLPIIDYQIISRSHKFANSFVRDHLTAWYFI